uniref:NPH3 domain-containing protein n=1 Tax=Heterorhabditis bacteriophora TaxID=37862 RepID=A0A1I7WXS8_HETBA
MLVEFIISELNDNSIDHCLRLLHPRMMYLRNLEKRKLLASALKEYIMRCGVILLATISNGKKDSDPKKSMNHQELQVNCEDISFLSDENQHILRDHDKIFHDAEKESLEVKYLNTSYYMKDV